MTATDGQRREAVLAQISSDVDGREESQRNIEVHLPLGPQRLERRSDRVLVVVGVQVTQQRSVRRAS